VAAQRLRHEGRMGRPELRGTLDVGEQEGAGPRAGSVNPAIDVSYGAR
jgi:hypothetical protein